jgi:cobalt/nickel transport protein
VRRFLLGFLAVVLLVAGGVSYLASSAPDGLDTVTLRGCTATEVDGVERLDGSCIAQGADEHAAAGGPLADYSLLGAEGTVGVAGVLGALVTLLVAGGLFHALRRRDPDRG